MAKGKKTGGRDFKPGNKASPGRPKGSRNKLGEDFVRALQQDFDAHGEDVIAKVREEKPDVYIKTIAQILPKDVNLTHGLSEELQHLSEEAIRERLSQLYEQLGGTDAAPTGVRTSSRTH